MLQIPNIEIKLYLNKAASRFFQYITKRLYSSVWLWLLKHAFSNSKEGKPTVCFLN